MTGDHGNDLSQKCCKWNIFVLQGPNYLLVSQTSLEAEMAILLYLEIPVLVFHIRQYKSRRLLRLFKIIFNLFTIVIMLLRIVKNNIILLVGRLPWCRATLLFGHVHHLDVELLVFALRSTTSARLSLCEIRNE